MTEAYQRYARQISLQEVGPKGQEELGQARVLVVGVGGLGSPATMYLAAAGIGELGLVDPDRVELSNLQRQILFATSDVGRLKVEVALGRLTAINPGTQVAIYPEQFAEGNASGLVAQYDFIIDATDNFSTKTLIAGACHRERKPYSHGGVLEYVGQAMTVLPGRTSCYQCVFGEAPETGDGEARGPMGFVPGVIGAIQAAEAIKYVLNQDGLLTNCVLAYNGLDSSFRLARVERRADCGICG